MPLAALDCCPTKALVCINLKSSVWQWRSGAGESTRVQASRDYTIKYLLPLEIYYCFPFREVSDKDVSHAESEPKKMTHASVARHFPSTRTWQILIPLSSVDLLTFYKMKHCIYWENPSSTDNYYIPSRISLSFLFIGEQANAAQIFVIGFITRKR